MPDRDAYKAQVEEVLRERYFPIIPQLPQNWTPEQHEKNRLSRSLAAFAIEKLANVSPAQAASTIMDSGNDNGIDALHFDRPQNRLWLIQSKASGPPDSGENKKFCDGVRDLVAGRFSKFHAAFARLQPDVEDALATSGLQIVACNIHLGDQLGPHAIADLEQLHAELNQFVQRFEWKDLNLPVVHGWLTAEHAITSLNVTLTLEQWYGVDQPRRAFYGLVTAEQLAALYQEHGKILFEKNIRHYLGAQSVNSAITATVQDRPEQLFFLNNGLTAICSRITPSPGINNQQGIFTLEGFSVVNGAQTVGAIASAQSINGMISPTAKLLITLIEVGPAMDELGTQITRARNTQNEVHKLHFAALDPQQERLRQELAISGISYHYRPSAEAVQGGPDIITIEQAAIALACFSGNTRAIVAAKKEISQIHDRMGEYYPTLFRGSLSGIRLCRAVRIFEYLDGILSASEQAETDGARRTFYRHGRFFILHILARRHRDLLSKLEQNLSEADKLALSRVTLELAEIILTAAEARFSLDQKGYLAIFRNLTDAEPLARDVMERLSNLDSLGAATTTVAEITITSQTPPNQE